MKNFVKSLFPFIPTFLRRFLYGCYEDFYRIVSKAKEGKLKLFENKKLTRKNHGNKTNILFYHPSILSFGGTEKSLQIIAKNLDGDKYNVFIMHGDKNTLGRRGYFNNSENISFIPFGFESRENKYPFFLKKMNPSINDVIEKESIDVILTAGSGYAEYPINTVKDVPIIMINIFGAPSTQKSIVRHVSISKEVAEKVEKIVPQQKSSVSYISSEKPPESYKQKGLALRKSLNLKQNDIVFGRIGRPDNNIFDSIGLDAFKIVVGKYPNAHYLILSPAPVLIKKVQDEKIPNIHFLEPTSDEEKIWSFHFAIDVLAHFRKDGESCGLNIIESMIAGKPIISHKSHIWNAHLEYLEPSFSRISEKDDYKSYANNMIEFIKLKDRNQLVHIGKLAEKKGSMFLIQNTIKQWEQWIEDAKTAIL